MCQTEARMGNIEREKRRHTQTQMIVRSARIITHSLAVIIRDTL